MALHDLTTTRVRAARLPVLNAVIENGGRCATAADDWFRRDGEDGTEWALRSAELRAFCRGCPVIAACREVGLRLDAPLADADMVRGGMSGDQLATMRRSEQHAKSLDDAVQADHDDPHGDAERNRINALAAQLREALLIHTDSRRRALVAARTRALSDELTARRAARRARTGWTRQAA